MIYSWCSMSESCHRSSLSASLSCHRSSLSASLNKVWFLWYTRTNLHLPLGSCGVSFFEVQLPLASPHVPRDGLFPTQITIPISLILTHKGSTQGTGDTYRAQRRLLVLLSQPIKHHKQHVSQNKETKHADVSSRPSVSTPRT